MSDAQVVHVVQSSSYSCQLLVGKLRGLTDGGWVEWK